MTNEQALKILDQICASVALSREQHVQAQQAVATLAIAIKPEEVEDVKGQEEEEA